MPRTIADNPRNEIQASRSGEVILTLATITHENLLEPIRVVTEDHGGVSYKNGLIVNYRYGGNLFLGFPFSIELLTDNERPPRGKITVPDVDRTISNAVLKLQSSPRLRLDLLALSDFSEALDADNARNPIGTPDVLLTANYLYLRNVSGDQIAIQADIESFDVTSEPWPVIRSTADRLPGLYR